MTAQFLEMPEQWSRADWLAWRREGIGGSDCAAVCGLSTFGSPMSVYLEKLGMLDDEGENSFMRWGRRLEPLVIEDFEEDTGLFVVARQALVVDPDHPWRRATLDGLVVEGGSEWERELPPLDLVLGLVEAKTTNDTSWDDGIPDYVACQICWQLGILQMQRGWLAVLHKPGLKYRTYQVDFDAAVFDGLCRMVDRFYAEHVLAKVPPPADSNPATTSALKAAYGDVAEGAVVHLDDEALLNAREWLPAKELLKHAQSYVDLLENRLRAALGDAEEGHDECGALVTWKSQTRAGQLDGERLKAERPDVFAEYVKPATTYRVLRPTKALRALNEKLPA